MEILERTSENLLKIINLKAKYQKVMVLFGEEISSVELSEIYNTIKEVCIYNQQSINEFNFDEINNGYRAIIYLCSPEEFVKLNFIKREFVNLVMVKNKEILPYCVDVDNKIIKQDLFLFSKQGVDINLYSSLCFNNAYNSLVNMLEFKENNLIKSDKALEQIEVLSNVDEKFEFVDMEILSKTNINYNNLNVVHLMLIDAFMLLLNSVKFKSLSLVDVYKICKDDYTELDKFYKMSSNENFFTIITLNYNYLYNFCANTKQEILDNFINCEIEENELEKIFLELKNYAKSANNLIGYLYLFDFFKI